MSQAGSISHSNMTTSQIVVHPEPPKDLPVMNKTSIREQISMYWKFFFEKADKVPTEKLPQVEVDLAELVFGSSRGIRTAWLGHSSLFINIDGSLILTDPVFEKKVSVVGPTRFNKEPVLKPETIPPIDLVIISHDHYDHLNKRSIKQLVHKTNRFVVPRGVGKRLKDWGVDGDKIVELSWWQEYQVNEQLMVAATPAQHFSGRGLFDRNKSLWASWVIKSPEHRLFFSGDSGYFSGFQQIGAKYGPFDVAYLECGAYNKRWSNVHMMPEQTVQAFIDLKGKILQPIHWATFNLALHPWYEPMERLTSEAWQRGVRVSTPLMGRVVDYDNPVMAEQWWVPAMERSKASRRSTQMALSR